MSERLQSNLRTIQASQTPNSLYDEIQKVIERYLYDFIYKDIVKEIGAKKDAIQNNVSALSQAIASGRVTFYRGSFTGKFNAQISKELKEMGAVFQGGEFKLTFDKVSPNVKMAIQLSQDRVERMSIKIDTMLAQKFQMVSDQKFDFKNIFSKALWEVGDDLNEKISAITVAPTLTPQQLEIISENYSNNLDLYIKDFSKEQILSLREKVKKNTLEGNRYEVLIGSIKEEYGVSERKAKFLARQETKLMMASFKESQYQEAGSIGYIWKTAAGSALHPVRPDHKILANNFYTWDDPPITNHKTGAKNAPGCDFGCRCYAQPVFKRPDEKK